MSVAPAWQQCLDFFATQLVLEPSPSQLSSDAGLHPVHQFDPRMGLNYAFSGTINDPRESEARSTAS
jgi:hypothetical protein